MRNTPVKITIFGSGAIASLFAARLSTNGAGSTPVYELILFGHWQEQIAKINNAGLQIIEQNGLLRHFRINATSSPEDISNTDIALICVKSYQTARTAPEISAALRPTGVAISMQNGDGNVAVLESALGRKRVCQAITTQGATVLQPGLIRHSGGEMTYFNRTAASRRWLEFLVQWLNESALPAQIVANFPEIFWQKLISNAAINPLTALLQVQNGALLNSEISKSIMRQIIDESMPVAAAEGISGKREEMIEQVFSVCRNTAGNNSSMLQDVLNERPTEIDAINGAIVRRGLNLGFQMPMNKKLCQLISNKQHLVYSVEKLTKIL